MGMLDEFFTRIAQRFAEIERRVDGGVRHGTVHPGSVDPKAGTVRLRIGGTDAEPQLSPPIRYGQTAGALKFHSPPSDGQQMTLISPGGDMRQGVAMPFGWSDNNKSPSEKGNEHVATYGDAKIEVRSGEIVVTVPKIKIVCGGSTFELTASGLKMVAPDFDFSH